jgi:hypothetical protein
MASRQKMDKPSDGTIFADGHGGQSYRSETIDKRASSAAVGGKESI